MQEESIESKYLKRFESEYNSIIEEIRTLSDVIPQYKSENESLRERLTNIKKWAHAASKSRYTDSDADAVLADLISKVLQECDDLEKLKPVIKQAEQKTASDELFNILSRANAVAMEDAMSGFDFYENNPYKKTAEKKIAKMKKKAKK